MTVKKLQMMMLGKIVILVAFMVTIAMITLSQSDIYISKNHYEEVRRTRYFTRPDDGYKNLKKSLGSVEKLGLGVNKYARMVNGNRRQCYNIGLWNCRKGLIGESNFATEKMVEVELLSWYQYTVELNTQKQNSPSASANGKNSDFSVFC